MAEMSNSDPQLEIYKKRFFDEVKRGNLVMIKAMAKKNPALLNAVDEDGFSVLLVAVLDFSLNVVEWLLSDEGRSAGFNNVLAKASMQNVTALHFVAANGNLECFKAIVYGCKVENGEREQMLNAVDEGGCTVLYIAANTGKLSIVKWLLSDKKGGGREAGFNSVLVTGRKGSTALHQAAGRGDLEFLKAIVEGCKVGNGEREQMLNFVDDHGSTVLHDAAAMGNTSIIKWLLSDKKGGGRDAGFNSVLAKEKENGTTALHKVAQRGDLECFKAIVYGCKAENGEREQMLNDVDDYDCTILHYAAAKGNNFIIKWLLSDKKGEGREAGFQNIFARDKEKGWTALHLAAQKGDLECFVAIVEGCKVENGEREQMLNAVTTEGYTVLYFAADLGHVSIIKWLMSKGRDLGFAGIIPKDCQDALLATAKGGYLEACKAIVDGCTVATGEREKLLDGISDDVLYLAVARGHTSMVSWLLSEEEGGGRALRFKNVLKITEQGVLTAFHFATTSGDLETCKAIVKRCKNGEREKMMNAASEDGSNALHIAADCGHADIVAWFLSHDADGGRANGLKTETITAVVEESQSALHCVVHSGSVETLCALLSGCTVGERLKLFLSLDKQGWTPLHYAAGFCRLDIIRELLLHHEETKMIADHRDHRGMTALHRVVLDGGVDEESKEEWKLGDVDVDAANLALREEVVAALLTYEYDDDDEEEEDDEYGQATSSIDRRSKQQQQAACIDVNAGLKIEK